MRPWRAAASVLAAASLVATAVASRAGAQQPVPRPGSPRAPARASGDTLRARGDTTSRPGADSLAGRDSAAKANFAAPDSVMQRLLNTPNYTITRYQGSIIAFDAITRGIELLKNPIVQRDSQLVKSDSSISYDGTGSAVRVNSSTGGRNVFVVPGQAPIVSSGKGQYDIANRRATLASVRTSLPQSGETLQITGENFVVVGSRDSTRSANGATYYLRDGTITACDDSIPDYYFKAHEIKRTGTFVVARPAVLYVGGVPVLWLPFLFQDIRGGRHSGILSPNFGVSDIVRNSKSYRRNIEGLGYYFALSDFIDAQASLDWRSSAGQADLLGDAGYMRYNGEFRYRWLERYVSGNVAFAETRQARQQNTAISWGHSQDFTRNSSLRVNANYVSNTTLQRQTTVNPYAVLSTIASQATYNQKVGPASFVLGATRSQSPGRSQVDQTFPTFSMNTSPLNLASWLSWTPNVQYTSRQRTHLDQLSSAGLLARAGLDSATKLPAILQDTIRGNAYDTNLSFDTPFQIRGYNLGNHFTVTSTRNDFPEAATVADVRTGAVTRRIYATTYSTRADWTPSFTLPPVGRNNFNLTPSLSFQNTDGNAYWIRNERTGGEWVHQSKRPTFGLSASPTLYGLYGGFGPFTRIRHSITPIIGYTFAPQGHLSDEYLGAINASRANAQGDTTKGYLGALRENSVSLQFSTNLEAKTRSTNDSNPEAGDKIKLLSLNLSGFNYNFERARVTGKAIRGLTTEQFNYDVRSDLLPGFTVGVRYSLFDPGSTLTDTAKFSPFREGINASFQFSNTANPFAVFQRLFGRAVPASVPGTDRLDASADNRYARQVASQPVAGRSARNAGFLPTVSQGWQASFNFTSTRQRPVNGANVIDFDPTILCAPYNTPNLRPAFDQCVLNARANASAALPVTSGISGSPIYRVPPNTTLQSNVNFNITEHWAASWNTAYDFERRNFASQVVSLQRDLHDWRAIFAFTQSPNGAFAFNFLISLKAEPDLKFDYHKSTYRNNGF